MYGVYTCNYLLNYRNHTKGDLTLKWSRWGSFDIQKLYCWFFFHTQLEKASYKIKLNGMLILIGYLEASKRGKDKVTSLKETNKKIAESYIRILKGC